MDHTGSYGSQNTGLVALIQARCRDLDLERRQAGRLDCLFRGDSHLQVFGWQFARLQVLSRIVGRARRERRRKELGGVMPSSEPPLSIGRSPITR